MKSVAKPQPRKRRSSEEIVNRLLDAAEAEFRRHGYVGATTAAIARAAEVTEAQLFRCFGSKAELFREAIFKPLDRHFSEFNARNLTGVEDAQDRRTMARLYITELQQFVAEHAELLMSLVMVQTYGGSAGGLEEVGSLRAYFERGAAMFPHAGGEGHAIDPKLLVRVSFAAVLANVMFKDWLFPKGLADEGEISEALIDFVLDGVGGNLDAERTSLR